MPSPPALTAAALAATLLCALSAGCSDSSGSSGPNNKVCTLIECDSGLAVELERASAGPFRIELLVSDSGPRYIYECPDPSHCAAGAFFAGFTGDYVRVRVTTAAGAITREVRPTYLERRPNGPDCPPVCRRATVRVPVPG